MISSKKGVSVRGSLQRSETNALIYFNLKRIRRRKLLCAWCNTV